MKPNASDKIGMALFLLPAIVLFIAFFIYPVFFLGVLSFFKWDGFAAPVFNGISNFINLFKDKVFLISLKNNVIWALVSGFIQVPLATLMALILSTKVKGWKIFRTVYFFPNVISGIALAMLWSFIYNSEFGAINSFLRLIGQEHLCRNWLGDFDTALFAVIIYWVFYIGYYCVIIMAEISSVDESLYEASYIDGASRLQTQIHITLPLIKGSIATCMTLAMVMGLRQFEQVFLLTNGNPNNQTSVMVLYLYKKMNNSAYGMANATAVVLMAVGVVIILGIKYLFREKPEPKSKEA